MTCDVDPKWLDAYADESCTPEERVGIEGHLLACASCAAATLSRMAAKRAIRDAATCFYPSAEFQLRMEEKMRAETVSEKSLWARFNPLRQFSWLAQGITVAVALILVVGSTALWTVHLRHQQALAELLDIHVATTASANPVDVLSTDRHTVKPWFQGKLPYAFNLPELQETPFKLIGGKLVYFRHTAGAQLVFDLGKHEISAFIFQDQPGMFVTAGTAREKGFSAESWSEGGLRYTVLGDTGAAEIHQLADLLRTSAR